MALLATPCKGRLVVTAQPQHTQDTSLAATLAATQSFHQILALACTAWLGGAARGSGAKVLVT